MPTWTLPFSFDRLPFPVSLELMLIAGRAAALIAAFGVLAWAFSRWRKAQERDTQRVFEQLDLIQGELHGLAETVATIATRLDGLAEKVATEAQLAPTQGSSGQRGYEQAIRLAQRGASSDEIVTNCGLARHEAELLVRLHGANTAAPAEAAATPTPARARLSVVG